MKKKHLLYAGIASAAVLALMFACILLTGSFTLFPSVAIDPLPGHAAGDLVVIRGTTNLKADERLILDIVAPASGSGAAEHVGSTDAVVVRSGGMSNTWSGALDTSAIPPGEYRVNAYRANRTSGDVPLASTLLTLTKAIPDPDRITRRGEIHKIEFIRIDKPGAINRGEKILVTGTTNLPADTELLYAVIQQSNTSVFTVDLKTGNQELKGGFTRTGLIPVLKGDDGINHWSFAIDSTEFIPDRYEVIVTTDDVRSEDIGKEGTFGTSSLTVLELTPGGLTPQIAADLPCHSIRIDPFPETLARATYTFTGTTTLPPGTELMVQVLPAEYEVSMNPATGNISGTLSGALGSVDVIRGSGGNNTWSSVVDLSLIAPGRNFINVSNDRTDPRTYETLYGNAFCTGRFNVSG